MRGVIKQLPSDDTKDPKVGFLEYEKDGVRSEVSFAVADVNEYISSLSIGDQVRPLTSCTPPALLSRSCRPVSLHGYLVPFLRGLDGSLSS